MTFLFLLLAQAATPADAPLPLTDRENAERFERCADLAIDEPQRAIDEANSWRIAGGNFTARQCIGLAYAQMERWVPAATAFEQAAHDAETARDGAAANLWLQAGNAQLAAGNPDKAQAAFSAALGSSTLDGLNRGEAHLDRARAMVALGNNAGARNDIDRALELAPADPLAWLLSATLARRMNDIPRAQKDIAEALKRSPDDASVAYEAGIIALKSGSEDAARAAWKGAIMAQPGSPAAKASEQALTQLDGGVMQTPAPAAEGAKPEAAEKPKPAGR